MPDDEPVISYSLKDVLGRMEGKLDRLVDALAMKADRTEISRLDTRVDVVDARVEGVDARVKAVEEEHRAVAEAADRRVEQRRWLVPTVATAIAAAGTVAGAAAAYTGMHP